MASTSVIFLAALAIIMNFDKCLSARELLDTPAASISPAIPPIPSHPKPKIPAIPGIPKIPSTLPPLPAIPANSGIPKFSFPPLPSFNPAIIPFLPKIPKFPAIPFLTPPPSATTP